MSEDTRENEEVPDEFLCPITREIMLDPVSAADGHTYERTAIEEWLRAGNGRSPATNEALGSRVLTPNHTLKRLIARVRDRVSRKLIHRCSSGSLLSVSQIDDLIEGGADVNSRDADGNTVLMLLLRGGIDKLGLARALLKRGALVAGRNDAGNDVFAVARMNGHGTIAIQLLRKFERLQRQEKEREDRKSSEFRHRSGNQQQQQQQRNPRADGNGNMNRAAWRFPGMQWGGGLGFFYFGGAGFHPLMLLSLLYMGYQWVAAARGQDDAHQRREQIKRGGLVFVSIIVCYLLFYENMRLPF